jgi:hypothetical protein
LAEILAENIQREDADTAARRQAVILSRWGEICDAYNHGWSYKEIWKGLEREGIVDFGYWVFQHYIRKIRRRLVEAEQGTAVPASEGKARARQVAEANLTAGAKPVASPPAITPGSTRVDIPGFGQNLPPRDPKKF